MKLIRLPGGQFAKVDDEDFERLVALPWHLSTNGYAVCRHGPRKGPKVTTRMHRAVFGDAATDIDHIDGDKLNNQRSNLRLATRSQNNMNAKKRAGCASPFKGVSWSRQKGKWHSRIKLGGKARHLGYFDDESTAAQAYNSAAKQLFGEFARVNQF